MAKSRYDEIVKPKLDIIEGWAMNGLTLDDIAHNLGITRQTLNQYKNKHEELKKALDTGREVADIRVENALYKRATGFTRLEQKIITARTPDGETIPQIVNFEKYYPPDVSAITWWLKNRKPDVWRDKIEEAMEISEVQDILQITQREVIDENADSVEATT